jgi:hypothetical protein
MEHIIHFWAISNSCLYLSLSLSLFLSSLVELGDMLPDQPQFRPGSNQPQYSKTRTRHITAGGQEVPYPIILSKQNIMSLSIARPSPVQSCAPLSASTGRSLSWFDLRSSSGKVDSTACTIPTALSKQSWSGPILRKGAIGGVGLNVRSATW